MPLPSSEQLREQFAYCPETGLFTKVKAHHRWKQGRPTGWVAANGYVYIHINGSQITAHRLAWFYVHGQWPTRKIDHINGNRTDNRIANLREASDRENAENLRAAHVDNLTGFLGVTFEKKSGRYMAQLNSKGKKVWCKRFATAEEAHAAYLLKKREYHAAATI